LAQSVGWQESQFRLHFWKLGGFLYLADSGRRKNKKRDGTENVLGHKTPLTAPN